MANIYITLDLNLDNKIQLSASLTPYNPSDEYAEELKRYIKDLAEKMIASVDVIYPKDK